MSSRPGRLNVSQLAQVIRLLTALQKQLEASPDYASEVDEQFGLLVPPEPLPDDLEYQERWSQWEDARMRDGLNAYRIRDAIRVLQELLERHERSRVSPRILNWYIGAPYLHEEMLVGRLSRLRLPISRLMDALTIAKSVHTKQQRDDGSFYLEEHVYPLTYEVARYLALQGADDELVLGGAILALLHDTLEDCAEQGQDCDEVSRRVERSFGPTMLAHTQNLTKLPKSLFAHLPPNEAKTQRQQEYFGRVQGAPYVVRLVKVLDRINNLLCVHKSAAKIPGYIEETIRFHMPLAAQIDSVLVEEMAYVVERLQAKLEQWEIDREIESERQAEDDREEEPDQRDGGIA